jgi:hypothetical protein
MGRSKKEITVIGRTVEEVRSSVQNWFSENKIQPIQSSANSIKGRWGVGFLTASKYFQVTFSQVDWGVIVQTEGWISTFGVSEVGFSPQDGGGPIGFIPRREGEEAMKRLWTVLESLSIKPPS